MEEMGQWGDVEKKLQSDIKTLEAENATLKQELSEAKESKELLARQAGQLEKEKERHLEVNSIEREQWRKERQQLATQLGESTEKIKQLLKEKDNMLEEIEDTKAKLIDIEKLFDKSRKEVEGETKKVKGENELLKEKLKDLKRQHDQELSSMKEQLQKVSVEIDKIKKKSKEDSIKEKNNTAALKRTIENQKKEIELLKSNTRSKTSALPVKQQQQHSAISEAKRSVERKSIGKKGEAAPTRNNSKGALNRSGSKKGDAKTPKSRRSGSKEKRTTSRSKSKKRNPSISKSKEFDTAQPIPKNEASFKDKANRTLVLPEVACFPQSELLSQSQDYATSTKAKAGGLEEISNEIFFLEREIADLNRQYKELLTKSQDPENEKAAANIRVDLNHIARLLEEKSERLFDLKKQQQLALKTT